MEITAVEAINATIRLNGGTFAAITHIRDNDTFSRPPTDLRGSSCGIRSFFDKHIRYLGAMIAVPAATQNIPLCRGAWQIRQINKTNSTAFLFDANLRCAWFYDN